MKKPVSKFYIQSGQLRWVLSATDLEGAAIRFVQLAFQETLMGQKAISAKISMVDETRLQQRMELLSDKVLISQQGYKSRPIGIFDTSAVIQRWRLQIQALEKLLRKIS